MLAALVLGTLIGGLAGFYGGWLDTVLMRLTDAMLSVPAFFLILVVVTVVGSSVTTPPTCPPPSFPWWCAGSW